MAVNSKLVLEKILCKMQGRMPHPTEEGIDVDDPQEPLRVHMRKNIHDGMLGAMKMLRDKGEELTKGVLGVEYKFSRWELKNGPLRTEMLEMLKPDITSLAASLVDTMRKKQLNTMSKTKQNYILKSLRNDYENEVSSLIYAEMRNQVKEQALKDVQALWDHMPLILEDGVTVEDIVAEQFTEMLAKDSDLTAERKLRVQNAIVSHTIRVGSPTDNICVYNH